MSEETVGRQAFSATIYKLGINPCVDVPEMASKAFSKRGHVPVAETLNGHPIRTTLVPKGGGRHRLYINGEMRKAANVDVGDRVDLVLWLDTESREIPVPDDLTEALRATSGALKAFEKLTPSHRKELLVWILDAKRPETRERRIRRTVKHVVSRSGWVAAAGAVRTVSSQNPTFSPNPRGSSNRAHRFGTAFRANILFGRSKLDLIRGGGIRWS